MDSDLQQQALGLLSSEGALMGGGLGTIQDEQDSNQDSDFSGDDDDKQYKGDEDDCGEDNPQDDDPEMAKINGQSIQPDVSKEEKTEKKKKKSGEEGTATKKKKKAK